MWLAANILRLDVLLQPCDQSILPKSLRSFSTRPLSKIKTSDRKNAKCTKHNFFPRIFEAETLSCSTLRNHSPGRFVRLEVQLIKLFLQFLQPKIWVSQLCLFGLVFQDVMHLNTFNECSLHLTQVTKCFHILSHGDEYSSAKSTQSCMCPRASGRRVRWSGAFQSCKTHVSHVTQRTWTLDL